MTNPFMSRTMITDPEGFFGREREIRSLLSRVVWADNLQSCAVVGPRRIGKSSLLCRLSRMDLGDAHETTGLHRVFVDLQSSRAMDPEGLFRLLRKRLLRALPAELARRLGEGKTEGKEESAESFEELMEALVDEGQRVVYFLDEFDRITGSEAIGVEVFSTLRYMANSLPMALVTSSVRELKDLCHNEDIRESPFFNIFTTVPLGLMEEEAAIEMLEILSERGGGKFARDEIAYLMDLAGPHPFYLQIAACWLWEDRKGPKWKEKSREDFLRDAEPHFDYMLKHLREPERKALLGLASSKGFTPGVSTGRVLKSQSVAVEEKGGWRLFSRGFREFLELQQALDHEEGAIGSETKETVAVSGGGLQPFQKIAQGMLLSDRYFLEKQLGRGGFGVVFRAEDRRLIRQVAIKFLLATGGAEPRAKRQERFLKEARTLAKLAHPNVIAVLDFGNQGDFNYLVMEYFEGVSLAAALAREGPFPTSRTVRITADMAEGLMHAHTRGVVHRDVSPTNVLMSGEGSVKILDFGIAMDESISGMTSKGQLFFNPRYCAPERLQEEPGRVDGRADIFSLGCVFFELLTGMPAYDGDTYTAVISQILTDAPPARRIRASRLPRSLKRILTRCLQGRPEDRYPSCKELLGDLRSAAGRI